MNLIGEHTDYTGGKVLPMALDMGVTISGRRRRDRLSLESSQAFETLDLHLPIGEIADVEPAWGRFPAAVARRLGPDVGFEGTVTSTLPVGGTGLSSSSALTCAAVLALGGDGDRAALATLARAAEIDATGVEIGIMDQLTSMAAIAGHALLIDCHTLATEPIALPSTMDVLVVHSGQPRQLADSEYSARRAACADIEAIIGPLRSATLDDIARLDDPVLRRRGRHVVTENDRVERTRVALAAGDVVEIGRILVEGHRSLADDYEVSTPIVEAQVERLLAVPGVHGVRMTGGGFGGALVVVADPGIELDVAEWWIRARPGPGASLAGP